MLFRGLYEFPAATQRKVATFLSEAISECLDGTSSKCRDKVVPMCERRSASSCGARQRLDAITGLCDFQTPTPGRYPTSLLWTLEFKLTSNPKVISE